MIRVLLADDQDLVRAGFRALLATEPDITRVGEAAEGRGCPAGPRDQPGRRAMEIRIPGHDGLVATRDIVADPRLADVRVVSAVTL